MGKKRSFEHESLQDCSSVVAYLEALTEGLRSGTLELRDDGTELSLKPEGLLLLSVRASQKKGRSRIDLRVSWEESEGAEPGKGPLQIVPGETSGGGAPQ